MKLSIIKHIHKYFVNLELQEADTLHSQGCWGKNRKKIKENYEGSCYF